MVPQVRQQTSSEATEEEEVMDAGTWFILLLFMVFIALVVFATSPWGHLLVNP